MPITTLSSREFNQNRSQLRKSVEAGPVFITDRGKPAMVVLSIEEYQRLAKPRLSLIEALGMPPGIEDVEFDPPRLTDGPVAADFT